jgi:catechol 2,3-dioxygenase-like lactoylglutathione lyase family enzyme
LTDAVPVGFVHVTSVERAREFYVDRLGLAVVDQSPFALVVRTGPILLRLTPVEGHRPEGGTVFGWNVPDIEITMDELRSAGIVPLRYSGVDQDELGIWQSPTSARVAWFADPDGNTLSVTQL